MSNGDLGSQNTSFYRGENPLRADKLNQAFAERIARSGDQMDGPLLLARDPVVHNEAATKSYVDNATIPVGGSGSGDADIINSANYGMVSDYVQLTGTISWIGNTVTITGANFTSADVGKTLIMPAGAGVGVYGGPAIVTITAVTNATTCTVDNSATNAFSNVTTVVGGAGASPWAVDVVNPGTGGSLVGDVLTITGGTFARPATLQTIQTTVLSATVVNAGTGGPVGAVLLRGTTGYGRRVVLSGNINTGGSLDPALSVTVLPAGMTTGADPGAYWYDADDPNNEPVLANPRKVTWPGAFVTGSATLTLNAAVLSPLVMPSVHVGASVFAVGDNGASAFPSNTVVLNTGTPNPTSVVVSQAATTNGTGQQISFTDNREDIIFPATFANNVSTVTATTAVPAGVLVGQVIFGLGISGGDDPTAPLSNCTITSIDGTRTAIGISRPTTHAATTAVNLHAVPYLAGAVVKLNLGPAVLAFKDFGAYSAAPDFTAAQAVLRNGSASPITIKQAPPPQVMTQAIKVSMGTDNTAAINAFWAAVRSALATNASGGAGLEAILRPGAYLTIGNINARDLNENGLTIRASGVMIHAAIANQDPAPLDKTVQRAWDASGSRYYTMEGDFVLYGDQLFPPDIGMVFAYSNANQITSSVSLNDINAWGYFKFAAVYQGNTEGYVVTNMNCSNHHTWVDGHTPCYGKMIDGNNSYNKLDQPGFQTHASFLGFTDETVQSTCAGGAVPCSIIGCSNYTSRSGYAASWSAPAIFFSRSGHANLEVHCEVETLTDNIFMWCATGPGANNVVSFASSVFTDTSSGATNSAFTYDTLGKFGVPIRAFSATNSSVNVGFGSASAFNAQVFDDHSAFTGTLVWHGDIYASGALRSADVHWLANFPDDLQGRLMLSDDKTNFRGDLISGGTLSSGGIITAGSDITTAGQVNAANGLAIGPVGFPQGKLTFDGTSIHTNVPIVNDINAVTVATVTANTIAVPAGTNYIVVSDSVHAVNTLTVGSGTLADGYDLWMSFPNGGVFSGQTLGARGNLTLKVLGGSWTMIAKVG